MSAAARKVRAPVTIESGVDEGLVQIHLWAGDVGLGLPEDDDRPWADLAVSLGGVVRAVDPALALSAVEWGVTSLLAPDYEELLPGLGAGRARRRDLDDVRAGRFERLAARGVVARTVDGWVWAARGALPLEPPVPDVEGDRLTAAVFQAWWGRLPGDPAPPGPRMIVVARQSAPRFVRDVAAAAPEGFWCEPAAPDAVLVHPPPWQAAASGSPDRLAAQLADVAVLVDARWAGVCSGPAFSTLHIVWMPARPDPLPADAEVQVTDLPGRAGVLLRGPSHRLRDLVAPDPTDRPTTSEGHDPCAAPSPR